MNAALAWTAELLETAGRHLATRGAGVGRVKFQASPKPLQPSKRWTAEAFIEPLPDSSAFRLCVIDAATAQVVCVSQPRRLDELAGRPGLDGFPMSVAPAWIGELLEAAARHLATRGAGVGRVKFRANPGSEKAWECWTAEAFIEPLPGESTSRLRVIDAATARVVCMSQPVRLDQLAARPGLDGF